MIMLQDNFFSPYLNILLPSSVLPKDRDNLICSVWNKIYNLLIECYWVLLIVGFIDLLNIIEVLHDEGFEEAKLYLLHSVVYSKVEDEVDRIKIDDLLSFLRNEYSLFNLLSGEFSSLMPKIDNFILDKIDHHVDRYTNTQSLNDYVEEKPGKSLFVNRKTEEWQDQTEEEEN